MRLTSLPVLMAFCLAAALCLPLPARGQGAIPAVTPPTTRVDPRNCVTGECHAAVKDHRVLHGPVNVDGCEACHQLVDEQQHRYTLTRAPTELCIFCHQVDVAGAEVVHQPLLQGECLSCHNPHGGFDRNSLRSRSMSDLCKNCHQDVIGGRSQVHGPVAAGACGACHQPHTSQHENLLVGVGRDLCLTCHQEMGQQLVRVQFVHEAVQGDCQDCHDAHASDHAMQIHDEPLQLCTTACHQDVRQAVFDAAHQHSAVTAEQACVNCHNPHGGDLQTLMKAKPIDLCLQCHDQPLQTAAGRTVAAVSEIADPQLEKHGPVRDGSCGGCHNVHGSDHSRLLAKPYPETFYESFALERFELCFSCHDQQLVQLPRTEGLTGFRDGEVNLHFLHVNKDKRGRTCRACHSTHASPHELHIRESVPYGNWELPINYVRSDTGGTCAPGCHQELGYDRVNPRNTPAAQGTRP